MEARPGDGILMVISLVLAVMLYATPLPTMIGFGRPEWVGLVMIYWAVFTPTRMGPGVAWVIGLVLDVLHGALLGKNALAMLVLVFLAQRLHKRLKMFPAIQQAGIVFILIGLQLLLLHWIDSLLGNPVRTMWFLLPAATSALFWIPLYFLLRWARQRLSA